METLQAGNIDNVAASDNRQIDSEGLKIEFINVYDEKEDDLVLAMNCSNG